MQAEYCSALSYTDNAGIPPVVLLALGASTQHQLAYAASL